MTANTAILYANGLFNSLDQRENERQFGAVYRSGFTTVELWAMHVQQNGDFHYSHTPMIVGGRVASGFNTRLGSLVHALKSQGSVERVMFGLGGADVGDFANIKSMLETNRLNTLLHNFDALLELAPDIDGFDLDLEETPYHDYLDTMAELTQIVHDEFGRAITFCPYVDQSFWIECLAQVAAKNGGTQLVDWLNLQVYGVDADPDAWAEAVQSAPGTGVRDGYAFVSAGYSATLTSPDQICQALAAQHVRGGFIWNLGILQGMGYTPAQYAAAIVEGVNDQHRDAAAPGAASA